MGEINRHGLRAAICSVLATGALAAAPAMAHNDDVDQPDDTATMSQSSATSSGTTTATAADTTTDADQSRSDTTTGSSSSADPATSSGVSSPSSTSSTSGSTTTDSTGPNRADLYSTGQSSDADARTGSPSTTTDSDQAKRSQASNSGAGTRTDVVWYILPVTLQAQSDQMSKGCWVQLYSGDDFEGRYVSVVGPAHIHEMQSPYGTGMNNWESAVVGPNATVTTYDGENFESRNAVLRAGQRYADLDDSKLGLFDDIESMKVDCTQSAQPGR